MLAHEPETTDHPGPSAAPVGDQAVSPSAPIFALKFVVRCILDEFDELLWRLESNVGRDKDPSPLVNLLLKLADLAALQIRALSLKRVVAPPSKRYSDQRHENQQRAETVSHQGILAGMAAAYQTWAA